MNREQRRKLGRDPEASRVLASYNAAATAAGDLQALAWASMVYACADAGTPARLLPPDWDRIVANAPEGYWEARGGPPEIVEAVDTATGATVQFFAAEPPGCGYEERYFVCVGVESPRRSREAAQEYPSSYVPSPFVCGRCPECGRPMSHVQWTRDEEWWPPTPVPEGASFFRLPTLEEAQDHAAQGYGGAHFEKAKEATGA